MCCMTSFLESLIFNDPEEEINKPITEDLNEDPYENPEHYMAILVESLSLLKRIPEAIEVLECVDRITLSVLLLCLSVCMLLLSMVELLLLKKYQRLLRYLNVWLCYLNVCLMSPCVELSVCLCVCLSVCIYVCLSVINVWSSWSSLCLYSSEHKRLLCYLLVCPCLLVVVFCLSACLPVHPLVKIHREKKKKKIIIQLSCWV